MRWRWMKEYCHSFLLCHTITAPWIQMERTVTYWCRCTSVDTSDWNSVSRFIIKMISNNPYCDFYNTHKNWVDFRWGLMKSGEKVRSWKWYGSFHIATFQSSAKIATQLFAVQKYRSLSMLWGHKLLLVFIKHRTSTYQLIPTEDLIFEVIRVVGLNWRGCYIILRKMTLQCIGTTTVTQLLAANKFW